jgi:hypothetical protein
MHRRLGHLLLTVLAGAVSAVFARQAAAEPVYAPDPPRVPQARMALCDIQTFTEHDVPAQFLWLTEQAQAQGYADLRDLLRSAPDLYNRLAGEWRALHPPPAIG